MDSNIFLIIVWLLISIFYSLVIIFSLFCIEFLWPIRIIPISFIHNLIQLNLILLLSCWIWEHKWRDVGKMIDSFKVIYKEGKDSLSNSLVSFLKKGEAGPVILILGSNFVDSFSNFIVLNNFICIGQTTEEVDSG